MLDILQDLLRCEGYDDDVELVFSLIGAEAPVPPVAQAEPKQPTNGLLPFPENPVHVEDLSTVEDKAAALLKKGDGHTKRPAWLCREDTR